MLLALRVAARFATRPIPLDKGAIRQLADRLAKQVATWAARQPPDLLLGPDHHMLDWSWEAQVVKGEKMHIHGFFISEPTKSPNLVIGAAAFKPDPFDFEVEGEAAIRIRLNGSKPFKDFLDGEHEGTNGLRYQINNVLVHELSHIAEFRFLQRKDVHRFEDSEEGKKEYYNSPTEVRAYMQQIVDEIMPKARSFKKFVKPVSTHDFVMKLLHTSPRWKQVQPYLKPHSEALILKGVYHELDAAGLV